MRISRQRSSGQIEALAVQRQPSPPPPREMHAMRKHEAISPKCPKNLQNFTKLALLALDFSPQVSLVAKVCKDEGGPYQPYALHDRHSSSLSMLPQVLQPSGCGQH